MLLFVKLSGQFGSMNRVVIPLSRVFDIWSSECAININYDGGELVEVEGTYQKKLETVRIKFDSSDDVDKAMRQFYKACNDGKNAFFFG